MSQPGQKQKNSCSWNIQYSTKQRQRTTVFTGRTYTVGEATSTYALDPEASKAANFDVFTMETFVNGLVVWEEVLGGDGGGAAGADSTMGLDGIGGGDVGDIWDNGATVAPMFRFKCISKSPTYDRYKC